MIVPGHVVFLRRRVHQHFAFAFPEHSSTGSRHTPSRPRWNPEPKAKRPSLLCWVFSGAIVATHRRRAFLARGYFSCNKLETFCEEQLIPSQRCQEPGGSSRFPLTFTLRLVRARRASARFYADPTTWTSRRGSAHIPRSPVPRRYRGGERNKASPRTRVFEIGFTNIWMKHDVSVCHRLKPSQEVTEQF